MARASASWPNGTSPPSLQPSLPCGVSTPPSQAVPPIRCRWGSWLFIPKRRAAAHADTSTTSLPSDFYTPETLAASLGVSTSTIDSWNSSGYGPPFVKLGNLVRYTDEDVELPLDRPGSD